MSDEGRGWTPNSPVRIVQETRRRGIATRSELEDATGLSKWQISRMIGVLVTRGFLAEDGPKIRGRHRPVHLSADLGVVVGVDVTVAEVRVAVANTAYELFNEPDRAITSVPINDPPAALHSIADSVVGELDACKIDRDLVIGVGLGLPGPIDRASGRPSSDSILPGWTNVNVAATLERALAERGRPGIRCVVANDASLGALGVFTRAVFKDPEGAPRDLVYVRITHGIGAGLVLKGHLVTGSNGYAGELGHLRVTTRGPLCPGCGARGCLETLASEHAIREGIRMAADLEPPVTIRDALASTHPSRRHAVWEAGWLIGTTLSQVVNFLNPQWIVLGGAVTEVADFVDATRQGLQRYVLAHAAPTVSLRTWPTMFDDLEAEPSPGRGRASREARLDVGARLSPELLGAMAFVVDELGDAFVLPRVEELFRSGVFAHVPDE